MKNQSLGWCTKKSFWIENEGELLILKEQSGRECGRVNRADTGTIFSMSPPDRCHSFWWLAEKEEQFANMTVDQIVWNVVGDESYLHS